MNIEVMKLTDPHDHPEPHTMKWTQAEMEYINNRIETAVRQAIEQEQRKPWVGLTDDDKQIAFDDTQEGGGFWEFADAIETTLRRKNHG